MNNQKNHLKVGLISFHRAINYGAILQVYALQEKIKEFGAECVILDYRGKGIETRHSKKKLTECRNIKDYIKYFLIYRNYNEKYRKFRNFEARYLNISKPYYHYDELKNDEDQFDKFIVGSDQVWNFLLNNNDPVYFLNFTKNSSKKNSYAASLGLNSLPERIKDTYHTLLEDFNNISVREKQGAELINEFLDRKIDVVLDPTLLISREKWFALAKENLGKKKYILVYAFSGSRNIKDFARRLSKKTGCDVIWIENTYKRSMSIKYIKSAGPEEFLGLLKNAEYIITNSFHCTAFSINFNKQFFVELLPEFRRTNSRLEDILNLFGLYDRKLVNKDIGVINKPIDYDKVNKVLYAEREKSIGFLRKIVTRERIKFCVNGKNNH